MAVSLNCGSASGTSLWSTTVTYTPSGSLNIPANTTNIKINFSAYVGYAGYYKGERSYTFEVYMYTSNDGTSYRKEVDTWPDSNRGYVEATFTIPTNYEADRVSRFTLKQIDRYNSNYIANCRASSDTAEVSSYNTLYTAVGTPGTPSLNKTSVYPNQPSITLSWGAATGGINTSVASYTIQRNNTDLTTVTGTSYTFNAPDTAGTYTYRVRANSSPAGYNSGFTSTVSLTVAVSAPSVPKNVRLDAQYLSPNTQTTLRWDASTAGTNNPVSNYQVYIDNVAQTAVGTTSYTVTSAASGTRSFKVVALGSVSGYNSEPSSTVTLYTFTSPGAPQDVYVSPTSIAPGGTATLGWSNAPDGAYNAVKEYNIYRSTEPTSGYTKLNSSAIAKGTGPYSYSVTAPTTKGATYYYRVEAVGTRGGATQSTNTVSLTSFNYTVVGAPDTVSVSPTTVAYNGTSTLSWSAGTGGTNTSVSSYLVYRSTDLTNWGNSIAQVSAPTTSVSVSTEGYERGTYLYYKVQSISNISGYDSALSTNYATLKVNSEPNIPTNVQAVPTIYETGNITVSWSGSTDPDDDTNLTYYVEYQINDTGDWVAWLNGTNTNAQGSLESSIPRGSYVKFRVRSKDSFGDYSSYSTVSNAVTRNTVPSTDALTFITVDNSTLYNPKPTIITKISGDKSLTVMASGYTSSKTGLQVVGTTISFKPTENKEGAQEVSFILTDEHGASTSVSYHYTVTAPIFTDDPIVRTVTKIKAVHMTEIRAMIDSIRSYYGLDSYQWSRQIIGGITSLSLWKNDLLGLREAMDEVKAFVDSKWGIDEPISWTAVPTNSPRADLITEVRSAITIL